MAKLAPAGGFLLVIEQVVLVMVAACVPLSLEEEDEQVCSMFHVLMVA